MTSKPHVNTLCFCAACLHWEVLARTAPPERCAETHVARTTAPCQHGFTRFCPSFDGKFSFPDLCGPA
jgi:hypothetical protein